MTACTKEPRRHAARTIPTAVPCLALVLALAAPHGAPAAEVPQQGASGEPAPVANHAPTGTPFYTVSIAQGDGATASGTVHVTDPDEGDVLTYALADGFDAADGRIAVDSRTGRWTYTAPDGGFVKPDRVRSFSDGVRFRIVATDRAGGSFTASLEVRVEYAPTFRTYHLHGEWGSDENDGLTAETAFRTFARANAVVRPGDTVLVHETKTPYGWHEREEYEAAPGLYASVRNGAVVLSASGLPDAWVTWKAAENERPVVSANGVWTTCSIRSSYTVVEGITFRGTAPLDSYDDAWKAFWGKIAPEGDPGRIASWDYPAGRMNSNGIAISKLRDTVAHHIVIRNCVARDFPASGFGIAGDYVVLENCTAINNGWWEMYASSGINVMWMRDIDENRGYKLVIRNNISAGNRHFIPWKTGNVRLSDGNGIIMDSLDGYEGFDYQGRILVANNLVYANGGTGIQAFRSNHIDMVNNTVFHNGATPALGWGEMVANQAGDVRMFNNLLCSRAGNKEDPGASVYDHNLFYNFHPGSDVGKAKRGVTPGAGNLIGVDPRFANVAEWNARPDGFDAVTGYPAEWRQYRKAREGTKPDVWSEAENAEAAGWYPGVDYDVSKREYDVTLRADSPALGAASDEWQAIAGGKGLANTIGIFCPVGADFFPMPVTMPGSPSWNPSSHR